MQLDKTELVIRQRSSLELLDLSLLVLRRHAVRIVLTSALIGIPLLVIDVLMIAWMFSEDSFLVAEHLSAPIAAMRTRYVFHLVLLYVVQFPLISLPTTVFLGNQIFFEPMPIGKLVRRLLPIAWRCILVLGLLRLGLVSWIMEFFVDRSVVFDWYAEFWLLVVVSSTALIFRACWPFAPEILGLELCPLRSGQGGEISYRMRSRGLHRLLIADHMARFFGAVVFGVLLSAMLLGAMIFCKGVATGDWLWNHWFDFLCLPLAMWLVGLFMAVYRFLAYLDSRIRLEGWEIELRLRAEADRLLQATRTPSMTGESLAGESGPGGVVEVVREHATP